MLLALRALVLRDLVLDFLAEREELRECLLEWALEDLPLMRPALTEVCRWRDDRACATCSGRFHPIARSARKAAGIWSTPSP